MHRIASDNIIIAEGETMAECMEQLAYTTFPTTITIEEKKGSQYITLYNSSWVSKQYILTKSYSLEYSRREILEDIATTVCRINGYRIL